MHYCMPAHLTIFSSLLILLFVKFSCEKIVADIHQTFVLVFMHMFPIKRTVFFTSVTVHKNTVRLIGNIEYRLWTLITYILLLPL